MSSASPGREIQLNQFAFLADALSVVAEAIGSPQFIQSVYDSVVRLVDFDAVHIDYARTSPTGQRNIGWLGSYGRDRELVGRAMRHYYRSYASQDGTYDGISDEEDVQLVQVSAARVTSELRNLFFDVADIHDECLVTRVTNGARYSISMARSQRLPAFSLRELSILKQVAAVVLPMSAAHDRLLGAIALDDDETRSSDCNDLARWLPALHDKLTPREAYVCSSFIRGMTTRAIAQSMELKPTTVETYAKRAFAKLGIESRRQLITLVLNAVPQRNGAASA
ncbi:helix-turn-helix transcriptional regulator [Burkholderia guangdongensis]|uniref:helix-turn-helix transcriptional regulator n=1 Tax=Burkholderia guangdongensis TaxID=1792500 RepID=UPI0015CD3AF1|nr:helix-turn-helix transcriptional regulator [Burkholderia guangdongensis]